MSQDHVPGVKTYLLVWGALLALLILTLVSAYVPMGEVNAVANLAIATAKAALVMLFYMHLRESSALTRLFSVAGFIWLALLVGLTLTDILTRKTPPAPW